MIVATSLILTDDLQPESLEVELADGQAAARVAQRCRFDGDSTVTLYGTVDSVRRVLLALVDAIDDAVDRSADPSGHLVREDQ